MASISWSGGTISPDAVEGYQSSRRAGTVVHPVLGTSRANITLRPAAPRSGILRYRFVDEVTARACEDAHCTASTFILVVPGMTTVGMVYAVSGGDVSREISEAGAWTVSVPFYEVVA